MKSEKTNIEIRIDIFEILFGVYMRATFQAKQTALTFSAQICPKMDLGLEIKITNVGIRISILDMLLCQFLVKIGNFEFFGPNLPKNGFKVGNSEK